MSDSSGNARTSYRVAYILCLLFGWMGMHRYYLRRWSTAILYSLAAVFLIGFMSGVWFQQDGAIVVGTIMVLLMFSLLFDLMILPLLVRQQRDIEAGIELPVDEAPWAKDEEKSWWGRFQLLLRLAILVLVPGITIFIAINLGQYVIVAMVLMLLAFSLLVGSIGKGLYALEEMAAVTQRVPLLPLTIATVNRFHQHYFHHRTGSVFFYLLYPIMGPMCFLFSPAVRSEFRAYLSLFCLIVFAVLFQNVFSYLKIFPPEDLGVEFGFWACVYIAIGGISLFFVCVVPMVSSTFYFSMTGRGFTLRTGAAMALVISGISILMASATSTVTFRGGLTAMGKMDNSEFRTDDFDWMNRAFLRNEVENRHEFKREWWNITEQIKVDFQSMTSWEAGEHQGPVYFLQGSTNEYRSFMTAKLRPEEAMAFKILAIKPHSNSSEQDAGALNEENEWLAVLFVPDAIGFGGFMGEAVLLYVISPEDKVVYSKWDTLVSAAPWIAKKLDSSGSMSGYFTEVDRGELHFRNAPNQLTALKLIDDLDAVPTFGPWQWKNAINEVKEQAVNDGSQVAPFSN